MNQLSSVLDVLRLKQAGKFSKKIFLIQKIILDFLLKCDIIKIQKEGENNCYEYLLLLLD